MTLDLSLKPPGRADALARLERDPAPSHRSHVDEPELPAAPRVALDRPWHEVHLAAHLPRSQPSAAGVRPTGSLREVPVLRSVVQVQTPSRSAPESRFEAQLVRADTLVVPAGVQLCGDLEAPSVHVQGHVHGTVTATQGPLIVDLGATVQGSVQGTDLVVIAGQVGTCDSGVAITARGSLQLACTARVRGDVACAQIELYEGATVSGAVRLG